MRSIEKNTNKTKGNASTKPVGVTACYSRAARYLECSPHLRRLRFGLFLTNHIACP